MELEREESEAGRDRSEMGVSNGRPDGMDNKELAKRFFNISITVPMPWDLILSTH